MANKLFAKPKTVREKNYTSISKHNAACGSEYILFDPPNVTSFECAVGEKDGKNVYIREKLACMWGNEDIEEYVAVDDSAREYFLTLMPKDGSDTLIKAKAGDTVIEYTHKKGRFSRHHYNVWFERNGALYYLYIRTSDGAKFKSLMEEFLEKSII
ncbi:MAG: hypothetical protein K2I78_03190 [Clostridia bacterium]|nr:hypothetical protein [Clostridia bacterium]